VCKFRDFKEVLRINLEVKNFEDFKGATRTFGD
jgi:hypothetical protein